MKFLLSLVLAFSLSGCFDDRKKTAADELIGAKIQEFQLQDLSGESVELMAYAGSDKPLILNIWATWCTPCIKELPSFHKLEMQGNYNVVTVATDAEKSKVEAFLKKQNLAYLPVLWDKLGKKTRGGLMATQLPMTYLLDTKGFVRNVWAGEKDWASAETVSEIEKFL